MIETIETDKIFEGLGREIGSVDWSFDNCPKAHAIESIHPYPAKFISEIPKTLLQILPIKKSAVVFDPFCGSGTTLSQAQRMGYRAIGVDLNPIACLISRVKTTPIPDGLYLAALDIVKSAITNPDLSPIQIPNVNHWFKDEIQAAISSLMTEIKKCPETRFLDALTLALSSIIVRVSNQESDTRYAAIEKKVVGADVFSQFLAGIRKIEDALNSRNWEIVGTQVLEMDTLKLRAEDIDGKIDIVITSPPYPNAYEYWLYHKYRMWWLGYNPLAVKENEIGARAHFFKKNPHTKDRFYDQMEKTFSLIDCVLKQTGFVCFVIGRSVIHGDIIDNAGIIATVAEKFKLRKVAIFDRAISAKRKSFNLSHAKIKNETILIFQK